MHCVRCAIAQRNSYTMMPRLYRRLSLENLLRQLETGHPIAEDRLRTFLLRREWQAYRSESQTANVMLTRHMRRAIAPYFAEFQARLRVADLMGSRPAPDPRWRRRFPPQLSQRGPRSSEEAYELALEQLEELLNEQPSLRVALDRPLAGDIAPCAEDVPRLMWSKSQHVRRHGLSEEQRVTLQRRTISAALKALRDSEPTYR